MVNKNKFVIGYWVEFDPSTIKNDTYYIVLYEYGDTFDIVYAKYDDSIKMWITQDNRLAINSKSIKYISQLGLGSLQL